MIILLSLVEEPQCHNKWKLILYMCAISPIHVAIISLKAEDKLDIISWKVKNIRKTLWYWDSGMCKWVDISFKCSQPNVEEINLLLSLFKKAKK